MQLSRSYHEVDRWSYWLGYAGSLQGNKLCAPLFHGRVAEIEAEANDAVKRINEAVALANETGEHVTDSMLHRIRGEIPRKRRASNTAPAEEAFLRAIAIARAQKARSFELQAALALQTPCRYLPKVSSKP
jgi:hypothetical protein